MVRGDETRQRISWTPELIEKVRIGAATGMTDQALGKLLGMSRNSICGARFRFDIPSHHDRFAPRELPDGFLELSPTMTVVEAAKHFKASKTSIRNWNKANGITPKATVRPVRPKRVSTPVAPKPRKKKLPAKLRLVGGQSPRRDDGIAACAQLYLQRFGPVIRARTVDRLAANDQWIVMGRRVSEPEMLAMAERKGFAA